MLSSLWRDVETTRVNHGHFHVFFFTEANLANVFHATWRERSELLTLRERSEQESERQRASLVFSVNICD